MVPISKTSGKVTTNDRDPNNEEVCSVPGFNSRKDGNVILNEDSTFTLHPMLALKVETSIFTYRICDFGGYPSQCSGETSVVLMFPVSSTLPVVIDFKGLYKMMAIIELSWVTNFEQNGSHLISEVLMA